MDDMDGEAAKITKFCQMCDRFGTPFVGHALWINSFSPGGLQFPLRAKGAGAVYLWRQERYGLGRGWTRLSHRWLS